MPSTPFSAALKICGLIHSDAADYFDVSIDTVKSWSAGRNPVPEGVWAELRDLWGDMQRQTPPYNIVECDDSAGWPCIGTRLAVMALAALDNVQADL